MSNESTINKLVEMRMTPMADTFRAQIRDPSIREISFEDRFALMVDAEYNSRKTNRLKRLIMDAPSISLKLTSEISITSPAENSIEI